MTMESTVVTFDKVVKEVYPRVYRFALKLTHNMETASDLAQETFLRAYRTRKDSLDSVESVAYFFKIAYHCFLDQNAYKRRRPDAISLDGLGVEGREYEIEDTRPTPDMEFFDKQFSTPMLVAINSLTEEQRHLVLLADLEGFSHKEISEVIGCGATTVKTRLHRAHLAMKRSLQSLGFSASQMPALA